MSLINNIQVTPNFKLSEFACKCGCNQVIVHAELLSMLQILRTTIKVPIKINSGYRCPTHNKKVGGVSDSYHMKGYAVDISIPSGYTVDSIIVCAEKIGFRGLGKYKNFVHLDVRPTNTRWDYR